MAENHYKTLGIPANASHEEIKSAYRKLAKEYHPDHYQGCSRAFQDIHEAYCVLGDPEKRREYEREYSPQRVRVRVNRSSPSRVEPLIPEEKPMRMRRRPIGRRGPEFESSPDYLFDWIIRHFL